MNNPDVPLLPLMLIRAAGLPLNAADLHPLDIKAIETAQNAFEAEKKAQIEPLQEVFLRTLHALPESSLRTEVYNARRKWHKHVSAGHWMPLKINPAWPLLPACAALCATLQTWNEWVEAAAQNHAQSDALYATQLQAEYSGLQRLAQHPALLRGLLFSSHDLLAALPAFGRKNPAQFSKKDRQVARSLWQYATRAAFKTSPLSHFTSICLKRLRDPEPELASEWEASTPFHTTKSVISPNVALLPAVYNLLLAEPVFYRALSVSLNPCIVRKTSPDYEWLFYNGELESFQRTAANPAIDFVVDTLLEQQRLAPFPELCRQLGEASNGTLEKTERYLLDLVDVGLLEWQLPEKGLSPNWCGSLYQFLGFLKDATPLLIETANLLQWLRAAARSLPFQSLDAARHTQQEAQQQIKGYFERFGAAPPPIPCEQIFFEEVETSVELSLPLPVLKSIATQLANAWRNSPPRPLSPIHTALARALETMPPARPIGSKPTATDTAPTTEKEGARVHFLTFCKKMLEKTLPTSGLSVPSNLSQKPHQGKIGALLQIYRDGEQWKAVVNALFPGGGKMMARWAHLFPPGSIEQLQSWFDPDALPFPWQDWHNAAFQPAVSARTLAVPGGRTAPLAGAKTEILIGNLQVEQRANGDVRFFDPNSGKSFFLTDLGLEAPSERPPLMRLLWQLGVPPVSKEMLWPTPPPEPTASGTGWLRWQRLERENLVLARARWQTAPGFFNNKTDTTATPQALGEKGLERFLSLRGQLAAIGVPRLFFARHATPSGQKPGKPQYFDADSPMAMLEFEKWANNSQQSLILTEMLPLPSQCFVQKEGETVAAECVIELEV